MNQQLDENISVSPIPERLYRENNNYRMYSFENQILTCSNGRITETVYRIEVKKKYSWIIVYQSKDFGKADKVYKDYTA